MKRLIILMICSVLIPALLFAGVQSAKTPVINYPFFTGAEVLEGPVVHPPYSLLDNRDLIGSIEAIGTTWNEVQHNGTIGRMVEKDPAGYLNFCWTNVLDYAQIMQHVYYNFIDPSGSQGWPGNGHWMESSEGAGFCTIDTDTTGRVFSAFHWTNELGGDLSTAVGMDLYPHTCTIAVYETPQVPGVTEVIWPRMRMDRYNILHIVSTENVDFAFWPRRHYYTRGTYDPMGLSISYDPWEEMIWTMTIAADVATSEVSDRIAFGWTYCRDEGFPAPGGFYSQQNNDLYILIDEDGVNPDWNQAFNLTNFIPPDLAYLPDTLLANMDTLRAYTDMSLFFDQNDYLHIAFTTPSYFELQGTTHWHAAIIWHWSEQYPDEFVMIHNAFDDFWWNSVDCGAWNVKAQRPSLGQDPVTGYLYCSYQVYDCDPRAQSEGEWPSGEVYVSVSTDDGLSWAVGTNVTQTITPINAAPGQCLSEMCPSISKVVDGECHILYVLDGDAGSAAPFAGTWTLNYVIYHNVPVDLIPTAPLVQQTVPFHVTLTLPIGPYIAVNSMGRTVFPTEGGILDYNVLCWEHMAGPVTGDVWIDLTLPNGATIGPILGPILDITYDWSILQNRTLIIPRRAPAGSYMLNAYWGDYPSITAENYLRFYKSNTIGDGRGSYYSNSSDWLEEPLVSGEELSKALVNCWSHPNPFNPVTVLSFKLQVASRVYLTVYDVSGRKVAELVSGWRDAGVHEVRFDGSDLASGVYLYRLETSGSGAIPTMAMGKMVLMK